MADKNSAIQTAPAATPQVAEDASQDQAHWSYRPHVDIHDTNDGFVIIADVPGASRDDIEVTFKDDVLSIGARVEPRHEGDVKFHHQKYGVGGFHRRFVVEAPVDPDRIAADYKDGVLTVTLPRAEKAKGRTVPVNTN